MIRDTFHYNMLLRALYNLVLDVSRDGTQNTSPDNLFQIFATLIV